MRKPGLTIFKTFHFKKIEVNVGIFIFYDLESNVAIHLFWSSKNPKNKITVFSNNWYD